MISIDEGYAESAAPNSDTMKNDRALVLQGGTAAVEHQDPHETCLPSAYRLKLWLSGPVDPDSRNAHRSLDSPKRKFLSGERHMAYLAICWRARMSFAIS